MYIYIHISVCVHARACVRACVRLCVCVRVCACVCMKQHLNARASCRFYSFVVLQLHDFFFLFLSVLM